MSSQEKKIWFILIAGVLTLGWHFMKPIIIPLRFQQLGQNCGLEQIYKIKDSKIFL